MKNWRTVFELMLKFGLVGLLGTVVNLAVYNSLLFNAYFHAHYLVSNLVAFLVAVIHNFLWNHHWAFKGHAENKSTSHKAMQFFIVSGFGFLLSTFLLWSFVAQLSWNERFANIVAIGCVSVLTFLGNYLVTFSSSD